ncbi:hypothetical protein ABZ912_26775 [Nonomuraea angiospora]|uniref:hypothetical protein n=1 Tax=Nonomuraea angiospora TaxID=46172 RepID=UPI0033DAD60E
MTNITSRRSRGHRGASRRATTAQPGPVGTAQPAAFAAGVPTGLRRSASGLPGA